MQAGIAAKAATKPQPVEPESNPAARFVAGARALGDGALHGLQQAWEQVFKPPQQPARPGKE